RDAAAAGGVAHDVGVGARGEAGVGVPEVLGNLVERAALVEQQRRAGVAKVVATEVRHAGAPERRGPDTPAPVLPAEVAALAVGKDECAGLRPALRKVEGDELARDRREQVWLACASRLRRRHFPGGERAADEDPLAWPSAVVEQVGPGERVRLPWAEAL